MGKKKVSVLIQNWLGVKCQFYGFLHHVGLQSCAQMRLTDEMDSASALYVLCTVFKVLSTSFLYPLVSVQTLDLDSQNSIMKSFSRKVFKATLTSFSVDCWEQSH